MFAKQLRTRTSRTREFSGPRREQGDNDDEGGPGRNNVDKNYHDDAALIHTPFEQPLSV